MFKVLLNADADDADADGDADDAYPLWTMFNRSPQWVGNLA